MSDKYSYLYLSDWSFQRTSDARFHANVVFVGSRVRIQDLLKYNSLDIRFHEHIVAWFWGSRVCKQDASDGSFHRSLDIKCHGSVALFCSRVRIQDGPDRAGTHTHSFGVYFWWICPRGFINVCFRIELARSGSWFDHWSRSSSRLRRIRDIMRCDRTGYYVKIGAWMCKMYEAQFWVDPLLIIAKIYFLTIRMVSV